MFYRLICMLPSNIVGINLGGSQFKNFILIINQ